MKTHIKTILFLLSFLCIQGVEAQENISTLTKKEKKAIISSIQTHLQDTYIDIELSYKMIAQLNQSLKSKAYKSITNPSEFSKTLTQDLQNISKDYHLKVRYEPKRIAQKKQIMPDDLKLKMEQKKATQMAEINYGFVETKILNGNIGYLNLRIFADTKYAEDTATSAMNFLSNTNAIIIDLRSNGGGVPNMVQLLASYFCQESPVLLSNFYERKTDTKTQLYTLPQVYGKRQTNKPLYILTSKNTFSAAEAFAYSLKHLDKAIIVGEVTKGGANRTKRISLNDAFTISVPYIKSTHPITKSNWEGKGIQPNIKTNKKEALVHAYIDAINKTTKRNKNNILNKIGYTYLKDKSINEAIIVFQKNAKLFPNNANSWDSLGEAYFANCDKENALKSYKKALALDPNSESAKAMIKKLESSN